MRWIADSISVMMTYDIWQAVNVALLGLNSFEDVQKAFKQSRTELSEILSGMFLHDAMVDVQKDQKA